MTKNTRLIHVGICLHPETIEELDRLAQAKAVSRSELVRAAVSVGLPMLSLGVALNIERALTILEHTQLALSLIAEREYPAEAELLLDMAFRNVEEYHG